MLLRGCRRMLLAGHRRPLRFGSRCPRLVRPRRPRFWFGRRLSAAARARLVRAGRAGRPARNYWAPLHILAQLLPETVGVLLQHLVVGGNGGGALVDVDAALVLNVRTGTADPAAAAPTMVIDPMVAPVQVPAEPGADGKPGAEGDEAVGWSALHIHDLRVVHGHVDVFGRGRHDTDVTALVDDLLLRV